MRNYTVYFYEYEAIFYSKKMNIQAKNLSEANSKALSIITELSQGGSRPPYYSRVSIKPIKKI